MDVASNLMLGTAAPKSESAPGAVPAGPANFAALLAPLTSGSGLANSSTPVQQNAAALRFAPQTEAKPDGPSFVSAHATPGPAKSGPAKSGTNPAVERRKPSSEEKPRDSRVAPQHSSLSQFVQSVLPVPVVTAVIENLAAPSISGDQRNPASTNPAANKPLLSASIPAQLEFRLPIAQPSAHPLATGAAGLMQGANIAHEARAVASLPVSTMPAAIPSVHVSDSAKTGTEPQSARTSTAKTFQPNSVPERSAHATKAQLVPSALAAATRTDNKPIIPNLQAKTGSDFSSVAAALSASAALKTSAVAHGEIAAQKENEGAAQNEKSGDVVPEKPSPAGEASSNPAKALISGMNASPDAGLTATAANVLAVPVIPEIVLATEHVAPGSSASVKSIAARPGTTGTPSATATGSQVKLAHPTANQSPLASKPAVGGKNEDKDAGSDDNVVAKTKSALQPASAAAPAAPSSRSHVANNTTLGNDAQIQIPDSAHQREFPGESRTETPAPPSEAMVMHGVSHTPMPDGTILQSASLLHQVSQSELRVGMHMGELGNVEIKTQLQHQQLRAEISVEHSGLSHLLSAELPGLQERLRDQNVPLATVVLNDQSSASSGNSNQGARHQQALPDRGLPALSNEISHSHLSEELSSSTRALDLRV